MTQAEDEVIEAFKRELALELRRITGLKISLFPEDLPVEIQENGKQTGDNDPKANHHKEQKQ